ncbi:MAG: MerR family DNA-binding transcriptional regulator [Patescibacteria group bacterium]
MEKRFLTIKEAAEFLEITPLTLRNWDKSGKLAARRHPINNYRVYTISELEDFLKHFNLKKRRQIPVILIED